MIVCPSDGESVCPSNVERVCPSNVEKVCPSNVERVCPSVGDKVCPSDGEREYAYRNRLTLLHTDASRSILYITLRLYMSNEIDISFHFFPLSESNFSIP